MRLIISFLKKIPKIYYVVFFASLVWISFFDADRFFNVRLEQQSTLKQLRKDKNYYLKKIEQDKKRIDELRTDKNNLEKFAREKYLMKRKNEDVFIIVDLEKD